MELRWPPIKLFFVHLISPEEEAEDVKTRYVGNSPRPERPFLVVLLEQTINSLIVGGIALLSSLAMEGVPASFVDFWPGLIAFGLTFLIEMRKYRLPRED